MKEYKENYLNQIRSDTAYPTYRGTIGAITFLGYLLVIINAVAFFGAGLKAMQESSQLGVLILIAGVVTSILGILVIRFFKEVALMIADIGDSITEANARSFDSNLEL